jgi:hypothetical protein
VAVFAQTEEYQLCITNKTDQIYAIAEQGVVDSLRSGYEDYTESYDDFIFHSRKLKEVVSVPVKIYISTVATFEKEKIDLRGESPFTYLFIKKGDKQPKMLKGVDSWASLKEQVDQYFSSDESKKKQQK